mmetsp:Transcript_57559/g.136906  ORF Transcript_57559/g.136906 Transcript_57559/m.136906 type:complete len:118 (+) Transcript_57559:106-459(+)
MAFQYTPPSGRYSSGSVYDGYGGWGNNTFAGPQLMGGSYGGGIQYSAYASGPVYLKSSKIVGERYLSPQESAFVLQSMGARQPTAATRAQSLPPPPMPPPPAYYDGGHRYQRRGCCW